MPRKKPNKMTHGQNRSKICAICHEKPIPIDSNRIVNEENYGHRIRFFVNENYNFDDRHSPKGLCLACRNKLMSAAKGNVVEFSDPLDYSQMNFPVLTRSLGVTDLDDLVDCECFYCVKARDVPGQKGNSYGYFKLGRFSNLQRVQVAKPYKVCSNCLQITGRGISHPQPCSSTSTRRSENVSTGILNKDSTAKERIASSIIKQKQAEAPQGATAIGLATGRNKEIKVPMPSRSDNRTCQYPDGNVPPEQVQEMMNDAGLSLNQTVKVQKHVRSLFGRRSFTPNSEADLRNLDKSLAKFFTTVKRKMDSHEKAERDVGQVERVIAYPHDLRGLIKHLIAERGYHPSNKLYFKFGLDGGGDDDGSLKLTLQISKVEDELSSPPKTKTKWSYSEGVSADKFKESGIMRLSLIGIVEKVNESQHNLKTIIDLLDLERIKVELENEGHVVFYAFDKKVGNSYWGLGTNAVSFPCTKCELHKKDFANDEFIFTGGTPRTLGSIRENAKQYLHHVSTTRSKTKPSSIPYMSCEYIPLCVYEFDDVLIWQKYPVMALHTMLGMVNDMYDCFEKKLEVLRKQNRTTFQAADWAIIALGLKREKYFGGNFHGNQCNKLLKSVPLLEKMLKEANILDDFTNFIDAFKAFNLVKDSCLGLELDESYKDDIKTFAHAYKKLDLNVTPKAHDLFAHTVQFLEFMKSKGIFKGLSYYGEQTVEGVHRAWDALWEDQSRQLTHVDYEKQLLQNVIRFNSRRVGDSRTSQ